MSPLLMIVYHVILYLQPLNQFGGAGKQPRLWIGVPDITTAQTRTQFCISPFLARYLTSLAQLPCCTNSSHSFFRPYSMRRHRYNARLR